MNKQVELKRLQTERTYHIPGMPNYAHRKRNSIFFGNESIKHVLAKAIGAYMLRKYGDVKFTGRTIELLDDLSNGINVDMKDFVEEGAEYVTEVVPNDDNSRRVDLVCLDTGARYEFETNHKVLKDKGNEGTTTIYI